MTIPIKGTVADQAQFAGKTLLVVEDEADLREPLVMIFEELGCKVFEASNGVEGFQIACRESLDLVISDIRMPGGDGIELLKNIKGRGGSTPIILITGFSPLSAQETAALGAAAILAKPFEVCDLEQAAARILAA